MYKIALTTTAITLIAGMASASLSDATQYLPDYASLVAGESEGSGTVAYETSGTGVDVAVGNEGSNVGSNGTGNPKNGEGEGTGGDVAVGSEGSNVDLADTYGNGTGNISAVVGGDGTSGVTGIALEGDGSNVDGDGSGNARAAVGDGSSGVTIAAGSEGGVGQEYAANSDGTNQNAT